MKLFPFVMVVVVITGCVLSSAFIRQECNYVNPLGAIKTTKEMKLNFNFAAGFDRQPKPIGSGSFGEVKVIPGLWEGRQDKFAIKRIELTLNEKNKSKEYKKSIVELETELTVLAQMSDSGHAPYYFGCLRTDTKIYIAQQCFFGDLRHKSFTDKLPTLPLEKKFKLYLSFFNALAYLWRQGFIHGDLKPANAMIDENYSQIHLIDFGMAQALDVEDLVNNGAGTPYFMCDDKIFNPKINTETDLYAACMTIADTLAPKMALFTGKLRSVKGKRNLPNDCFLGGISQCLPHVLNNVAYHVGQSFQEAYQRPPTMYSSFYSYSRSQISPDRPFADLSLFADEEYDRYYKNISPDEMNFTTLIVDMLDYKKSGMNTKLFFLTLRAIRNRYKILQEKQMQMEIAQKDMESRIRIQSMKNLNGGFKENMMMSPSSFAKQKNVIRNEMNNFRSPSPMKVKPSGLLPPIKQDKGLFSQEDKYQFRSPSAIMIAEKNKGLNPKRKLKEIPESNETAEQLTERFEMETNYQNNIPNYNNFANQIKVFNEMLEEKKKIAKEEKFLPEIKRAQNVYKSPKVGVPDQFIGRVSALNNSGYPEVNPAFKINQNQPNLRALKNFNFV